MEEEGLNQMIMDRKQKNDNFLLNKYTEEFRALLTLDSQEEDFDGTVAEARIVDLIEKCPALVPARRLFTDVPPLHCACLTGASLYLIQRIYEADEKAIDFHHGYCGITVDHHCIALFMALQGACDVEVLRFLYEKQYSEPGSRSNLPQINFIRSLAFYGYANLDVTKFLLEVCHPKAIQDRLPNGDTIVHRAIIRRCFRRHDYDQWVARNSQVVKFLVATWPQVLNVRNDAVLSPLHVLLWHDDKDTDLVEFMVRENPNALSYFKLRYPLIWIFQDHPSLIELTAKMYPRQYINLQDAALKAEGAFRFAKGLNQNPFVQEVALERGSMVQDGLDAFLDALDTKLDSLFISFGNDCDGGSAPYPNLISRFLSSSPRIKCFSTTQPVSTSSSLGMEHNTTLEELYISVTQRNDLSDLVDALISNMNKTSLKRLHIDFVGFCSAQLESLTRLLQHEQGNSIEALHLSGVSDECMALKGLSNAMRDTNTTLLELELEPPVRKASPTLDYHRTVLAYYARLNKAGRGRGRASKEIFVNTVLKDGVLNIQDGDCNILSEEISRTQVLYGLLRDMPHIWSN
jgi:hypothetical protein